MPNSAQLRSSSATWRAAEDSRIGMPPKICAVSVGVEWSMVAKVRPGWRTLRLRSRSTV